MTKKQDNKWLWVIGIIVAVIFLSKQQGFMGAVTCTSNEPDLSGGQENFNNLQAYLGILNNWVVDGNPAQCGIDGERVKCWWNTSFPGERGEFTVTREITPVSEGNVITGFTGDCDFILQKFYNYSGMKIHGVDIYTRDLGITIYGWCSKTNEELISTYKQSLMNKYFNTFYTCQETPEPTPPKKKDDTIVYVLIGAGVLLLMMMFMRRN